jgi:PAS domain S-box-containing protein
VLNTFGEALLDPPGENSHFVRFYHDDAVLLDEVAQFIDSALRAGGTGVVIATAAHGMELRRRLVGLDSSGARPGWFPGQLVVLDAEQVLAQFMVGNWPDEQRFNATVGELVATACAGGGSVHAFGEMVALLCAQEQYEAAVRLEQLWNGLAEQWRFSLFCAYPWQLFATTEQAEVFQKVCAEHEHACSHTQASTSSDPIDPSHKLVRLEQKALALEAEVARRKEAEQTLLRREKEFADFVENAAEGLHRVGADGTILWANRAELTMLGYRWEEYVGRHIAEFHVDAPVIESILGKLGAGETLYDQPARLRCKDGSIKHVLVHSNGCFQDGELRYTRCFTRDATERHERDEALAQRDRVLLNAPVAAALLVGPEFTFRLANRRYCELANRAGLEGKAFLEAFPELQGSELVHLLDQVYRTAQPFSCDELRIVLRRADGQPDERFFQFSLEPLTLTQGPAQGIILVGVDVTEHVRTRQHVQRAHTEREQLLVELTAASRAKDEFLAMLGHELRNPLAPIVSALELMRMRGDAGAVRERDIITRQVEHLVRLVDDLLDVSRVTRGKIELKLERVEVAQPLSKAVEMASLLLQRRGHRLDLDIEPGLYWEGDPVRLAQVVTNLLTNAARYTDPGGRIVLGAAREGAQWLRISVADNGMGLAPDMLTSVFGLFVQGKRSMDRSEGGLGVGLALVKNIVELHGGSVEACSEGKGQGSEFIVRLPIRPRRGERSASAAPAPAMAPPEAGQYRIMVVDDNVDGAAMLGRLFEEHGHLVEVFHDPVAALASVQQFRPDIAVLDIGLPVLDGYQLATRMRARLGTHPCRLIALSGYGQDADKDRSREAGFELHLVKPISPDEVAALGTDPDRKDGRADPASAAAGLSRRPGFVRLPSAD